jgi:L,D-peptidoglycan transpeptidase YkuD (ErfK/YbiS/YcfS/YnhG family)
MVIKLKNKHILEVDEFQFRCCIGRKGITNSKVEGDLCTPKGKFKLKEIFLDTTESNFLIQKLKLEKLVSIWAGVMILKVRNIIN